MKVVLLYIYVLLSDEFLLHKQLKKSYIYKTTYFTDKEKSPGVLSLSLIKNAPSMGCFNNSSSALLRVIRP